MRLCTTTGDFVSVCSSNVEAIRLLGQTPFRYVDIDFYGKRRIEMSGDNYLDTAREIKSACAEYGITPVQAHACDFYPDCGTELYMDTIKNTIRACGYLGIKNVVVHSQTRPDLVRPGFYDEYLKWNKELYMDILPLADEYDINILTENKAEKLVWEQCYVMSGADINGLIDYVGHPRLKAVWDTGHGNLREGCNQYDEISALGKNLAGVHIQDNCTDWDLHTAPFFGTVSVDDIMRALIQIGYNGYFTFEADRFFLGDKLVTYISCDGEKSEKDILKNPGAAWKVTAEKMLYSLGEYILKSYGVFEE